MLEIPGEYGSGSGTIVRLATAFSALTGKAIRVTDIRAKRPNPGLHHQHLEAVRALAKMSSASLKGDEIGSKDIEFVPKKMKSGTFEVNIETAGSIGLLCYAAMIPALSCDGKTTLKITGGSTASMWAPPVYYMENVLFPILARMGIEAKFTINRHGFYPQGGSDVIFEVNPSKVLPIVMTDTGKLETITGLSIASTSLKEKKRCRASDKGIPQDNKEGKGRRYKAALRHF